MSRRTFWQWLIGREPAPPAIPPPAAEPQHLGSADEAFLAKLVADLADGKRRGEIADAEVLRALDGLWTSGHERLAIEWLEKLLSVPEVPAEATAPLRAVLVERYEQRGELDSALPHLERLTGDDRHALRAHYLLAEHVPLGVAGELGLGDECPTDYEVTCAILVLRVRGGLDRVAALLAGAEDQRSI